jgi:hypothetical protein
MESYFTFKSFLSVKTLLLTVTKFITLLLCMYLIFKYKEYNIKWNLLSFFFPQAAASLNEMLSFCSTIILIIPFSLIVLSFLIPESLKLRLISGFFAIMGTTISIVRGFLTDTLGHAYNFGFIVVTHIATLEAKKKTFMIEFERLSTELCDGVVAKKDFLMKYLSPSDFVIYEQRLNLLDNLDSVKKYTHEVCLELDHKYNTLHVKTPFHLTDYVSLKTILIVTFCASHLLLFYG